MPSKKAASAYFIFCNENREVAREKYFSEAGTDKVNVAAIAKILGEQWRSLSDEQKKTYQTRAAEQNAANAAAAVADDGAQPMEGIESNKEQQDEDKEAKTEAMYPYGFPLTTVKRIVNMDEEVKSISSDALKATSKAAELVVQSLAMAAYKAAASKKQKTIKFSSVLQAVTRDKRWEAAGLKDVLLYDELFEEARSGAQGTKMKAPENDPKAQQITSFFKA